MKVKYKTKKIKYNNEKQGFGGTAPNKVESYAVGVVSEHEVQMNHAIGMDITLFWKKKRSPVNNFFLGEYGKLCALLSCAVNVFFGIYCLSCMSLEGCISIGNIRISHGKWQSRLSRAVHLQMSNQLTLCSQQHARQCAWCRAHCCQQCAWVPPHKYSQKFRKKSTIIPQVASLM